jgi:spore germination protein GerM
MRRRGLPVRGLLRIICVLAFVSALSGCGVATQNTATPLPSSLGLSATSTTTTVPASQAAHQLEAYFLKEGRLYAVNEPYSTDPLGAALEALDIGPSADEAARGITTAFSESPAQITSAGVTKDGVAFVKVDNEFTSLPGEALEEAFAQIVFTVIGLPNGPTSVEFLYLGYHLDALVPPGQLLSRGVTRLDYCLFAPSSYLPCRKVTGTEGVS